MNLPRWLQRLCASFTWRSVDRDEPLEQGAFRLVVRASLGMFAVLGLSAVGAFFLTLRGPERIQVPQVTGMELIDGLLALQERGLIAHVQQRTFADPGLAGTVVSQRPDPGALVRVGREVTLVVSGGAIIETVVDFRGRSLQAVRAELQALGGGVSDVLVLAEPIYVFNQAPVGTVVEQEPYPGTELTGPTRLSLVVSRGPQVERIAVVSYVGLPWRDALRIMVRDRVPFVFVPEDDPSVGPEGTVSAQTPAPGEQVERGTPVTLTVRAERGLAAGEVFGFFDYELPRYATEAEVSAVAIVANEAPETLFTTRHGGGPIAFPYRLRDDATIVLYHFDEEVVRAPAGGRIDDEQNE